jgi:hypothetical protein
MIRFGTSACNRHWNSITNQQSPITKQSKIKLQKSPIDSLKA